MEQKSFLRSFVKRVEFKDPQVVIDYTVPLPINELTTTEEVLRIDKPGSPSWILTNNLRAAGMNAFSEYSTTSDQRVIIKEE